MSRDIFTGSSGSNAAWRAMEVVANNVANQTSRGYRAAKVSFQAAGEGEGPLGTNQVQVGEVRYSQADGQVRRTDNPHDIAVRERAWLVVDVDGEELLTRDGELRATEDGTLTIGGRPVQGQGGAPIVVDPEAEWSVSKDGRILDAQGEELGALRLVTVDDIEPVGGTHYRPDGQLQEAELRAVQPGFLEGSNASVAELMVDLIEASRFFEACQKCVQASDEMDSRSNRTGGLQ